MKKIALIIAFFTLFSSCYTEPDPYMDRPQVQGKKVLIPDSVLNWPGLQWDTTWLFEHTFGHRSAYSVKLDEKEFLNTNIEGAEVDTVHSMDRITYAVQTTDLSPDLQLSLNLDLSGETYMKFTAATYNELIQITGGVQTVYEDRVLIYHDTLSLKHHVLHDVYEIYATGKSLEGRIKGMLYSKEHVSVISKPCSCQLVDLVDD